MPINFVYVVNSIVAVLLVGVVGVSGSRDGGGGGVVVGASHSSPMVAAPDLTDLKQYSMFSGAPSLQSHCQR